MLPPVAFFFLSRHHRQSLDVFFIWEKETEGRTSAYLAYPDEFGSAKLDLSVPFVSELSITFIEK